jgi:hypothetical protein
MATNPKWSQQAVAEAKSATGVDYNRLNAAVAQGAGQNLAFAGKVVGLLELNFAVGAMTGSAGLLGEGVAGGAIVSGGLESISGFGPRVFWSGGPGAQSAAAAWANANGGITLEMTEAGQSLQAATRGMSWEEASPLWDSLAQDFARGASGDVPVFQSEGGLSIGNTWARTEYPTLLSNPNVTGIGFFLVSP